MYLLEGHEQGIHEFILRNMIVKSIAFLLLWLNINLYCHEAINAVIRNTVFTDRHDLTCVRAIGSKMVLRTEELLVLLSIQFQLQPTYRDANGNITEGFHIFIQQNIYEPAREATTHTLFDKADFLS